MADASLLGRTFRLATSQRVPLTTTASTKAPIRGLTPLNSNFDDVLAMPSHFDASSRVTTDRQVADAIVADLARRCFKLELAEASAPV